jgi:hypothetical protein
MLYDLRVRLNYMKLDLAILLASLPTIKLPAETESTLLTPSHTTDSH